MRYTALSSSMLAVFFGFNPAHSAIISSYDFESSYASGATDPNITASAFGPNAGSGISNTSRTAATSLTSNVWQVGGNDTNTSSDYSSLDNGLSDAINRNVYASFTVTIPDGVTVNLTSLNYDWGVNNNYEHGIGFFSDATGFTTGSDKLGGMWDGSVSSADIAFLNNSIDLTGVTELQGLTNTSIEFRVYVFDRSGSNTRWHELDNLVVSGDVTIPEPSTLLLGGMSMLLLLRRRR